MDVATEINNLVLFQGTLYRERVVANLSRCDFSSAVRDMASFRQFGLMYPSLFPNIEMEITMLIGLCLMGIGDIPSAVRAFAKIISIEVRELFLF